MKGPTSRFSAGLAIVLLLWQALAPLAHLTAHAITHQHCPVACAAPASDSDQVVNAETAAHRCSTCLMIARLLGASGEWAPRTPMHLAHAHSALAAAAFSHRHTAFDFNAAAARGPPAFSLTAV